MNNYITIQEHDDKRTQIVKKFKEFKEFEGRIKIPKFNYTHKYYYEDIEKFVNNLHSEIQSLETSQVITEKARLYNLNMSFRLYNTLIGTEGLQGASTLADVGRKGPECFRAKRNYGKKSEAELRNLLNKVGVEFKKIGTNE